MKSKGITTHNNKQYNKRGEKRLRKTFPLEITHDASVHPVSFNNSILHSSNRFAEEFLNKGGIQYCLSLCFICSYSPSQSPVNKAYQFFKRQHHQRKYVARIIKATHQFPAEIKSSFPRL